MKKHYARLLTALFMVPFGVSLLLGASSFHVSTSASASGNGTRQNPWQLQVALNQPSAVQPGDTIWIHGGVYHGYFKSELKGTAGKPIVVRQYPGERVSIDGGDSQQEDILRVNGSYTWYWGLEIYSSDPVRYTSESGSFPSAGTMHRGVCINTTQDATTVGNKFINMVLHDGFNGFGAWVPASNEIYGSVLYNNGWDAPDRPHGHNIYIQNTSGAERRVVANIVWGAFENNVQAYGTRYTDDFYFEKNAIFAHAGDGRNLLIGGGGGPAKNPTVINNYLYDPSTDRNLDFGWEPYGKGIDGGNVTGNYFMGGGMYLQGPITNTTISGNTFYAPGGYVGFSTGDYPSNTYVGSPSDVNVSLVPNVYEPGRANIIIYNWKGQSSVSVDISSVLSSGDTYQVLDSQNFYGTPVASGKYTGGSITIPMTGLTAVSPIGKPGSRKHTAPYFGAFVLVKSGTVSGVEEQGTQSKPKGFELGQNYPNPFNPSTTIAFDLPVTGQTTLRVYNALGSEIATLVSENLPAGHHTVAWHPIGLSSGVYFYRLTSGSFVATKRLTLLK